MRSCGDDDLWIMGCLQGAHAVVVLLVLVFVSARSELTAIRTFDGESHAILGRCKNIPPTHAAGCTPLVTSWLSQVPFDCAGILQDVAADGGDTINVHSPSGFCQVQRCGPKGGLPADQIGGLMVPLTSTYASIGKYSS